MTDRSDDGGASAREPQPEDERPTEASSNFLRVVGDDERAPGRPEVRSDPRTTQRSTPRGKVKASFNLLPEDLATIRALSEDLGTTVTNVLQRAIRDQRFVREQIARGNRFAIVDRRGVMREIIWR